MTHTWDNDGDKLHLFNIPSGDETEGEHLEVAVNNFCSWHLVSGGRAIDKDQLVELFMKEYGAIESQRDKVVQTINNRIGS